MKGDLAVLTKTPGCGLNSKIMNRKAKFEMAVELINDLIDRTNERWTTDSEIRTYAWGWRNSDTLSSLHDGQFFFMDEISSICRTLGLNYSLTVGENLDGVPTPFVSIF